MENLEQIHCHAKGLLEAMENNEDVEKTMGLQSWREIIPVLEEIISKTEGWLKAKSNAQKDENATQDAACLT